MFKKLGSYKNYLEKYPIHKLVNVDISEYSNLEEKVIFDNPTKLANIPTSSPFPAEIDNLIRLHFLVISRKVTTILEFGVGNSSLVFENALDINAELHSEFVSKNLRRGNPFQCFSVDNNQNWIDVFKKQSHKERVSFHHSNCNVTTFNDRICTLFDDLPNICADLIYLDGPDQHSPLGNVRGVHLNHPDRLPMSADILCLEHFLLPGTLIVVDGRTANARFLQTNLQRNWSYNYFPEFDQHFFELIEEPLGIYNKRQIDFCLGPDFYTRIQTSHN